MNLTRWNEMSQGSEFFKLFLEIKGDHFRVYHSIPGFFFKGYADTLIAKIVFLISLEFVNNYFS